MSENPRGANLITVSRMDLSQKCKHAGWMAYTLGIRRTPGEALRFGGMYHDALNVLKLDDSVNGMFHDETVAKATQAITDNYVVLIEKCDDPDIRFGLEIEAEKCRCLIVGWAWRWKDERLTVLQTETTFNVALRNPKTKYPSKTYRLAGKIDVLIASPTTGNPILLDHKTTGVTIDDDLRSQLGRQRQLPTYMLALREQGVDVSGAFFDVALRPKLSASKVPIRDDDGFKIVLDQAGERVHLKTGKPRQAGIEAECWVLQERLETVEEFGERLIADIYANPEKYFARWEVPFLESDLDRVARENWQIAKNIAADARSDCHPQNPGACKSPYPCAYLPICQAGGLERPCGLHSGYPDDVPFVPNDDWDIPEGYECIDYLHPELLEDETDASTEDATAAGGSVEDASDTKADEQQAGGVCAAH